MLLVTADEAWHISRPLVDFGARQPVGVGDLTSGLLLVDLLKGEALDKALEHVTAAVYEVMLTTQEMGEYELQVVAAQDRIVQPRAVQSRSNCKWHSRRQPPGRCLLQSFGVQRRIYRARRNAIEPGRQMGVLAHVELQGKRPTQHGEQVGVSHAETLPNRKCCFASTESR